MKALKVEFIGKFYDNHSIAIVNRELALELSNLIEDFSIVPTDSFDWKHKIDKKTIKKLNSLIKKDDSASDIQLRHCYPPLWNWPTSSKTKVVMIQPWEFSRVPSEWQYKFETFADAVISPSNWTSDKYLQAGMNPKKLFTIANGYNPAIFNTENKKESDKIRFMYVGCHQHRKGIDILINAWVKAFSKFDNVELIIKDTPSIYGESNLLHDIVKTQYTRETAKITYIDGLLSQEEMADLYKSSRAIVHPYRGEGFGMHIQEAMACGCVPIVSGTGSTDDFVLEDKHKIQVSHKIVDLFKVFAGKPGDSFTNMGSHAWMIEPSIDHLANLMVEVYKNNDHSVDLSVVNNNTWNNIAKEYLAVFRKVSEINVPIRERLSRVA